MNIYDKHNFKNNYNIINKNNNESLIINLYQSSNHIYVNSSKDYWEKRYSKGGNSGSG